MAYWLFKTEPDDYSYQDLEKEGRTVWDGVGNNLALKYMREVHKGDLALVYHTGDVRAAIGILEVVSEPYADPKLDDPKMVVFDVKPKKQLTKPVTLAQVKAEKAFADFLLVTNSRLSVMPITVEQWKYFST
ncbi:MAG: EVE domain-containing protein [Candidatus Melainabacteria bacterium]|nr:EVE domain-containing protein [Candidatus Melainabacteria bacterium]